jgi:quinol monooxygenase YgiN
MKVFLAAVVAVLALTSVAIAGRIDDVRRTFKSELQLNFDSNLLSKEPVYFVVRFNVPPALKDKFMDAWKTLEKKTQDEKGFRVMSMKKVVDDNDYFLEYQEWETGKSLYDHLETDHFQDFEQFVDESIVTWSLEPLYKIEDQDDIKGKKLDMVQRRKAFSKKGAVHVLTTVSFVPSQRQDIADMWHKTAKETVQEEGNLVLALHRRKTNNVQFYFYGAWDSFEAYMDHRKSKHHQQLHEYFDQNNIRWKREIMLDY